LRDFKTMAGKPFQKGNPGGPGRPRKAEKFSGPIAKAEKQIADRLPQLIDNLLRLAEGVWVEETTPTGQRITYKTPPDRQSNEYLINRILGKPTERREDDVSGALRIQVVYADIDPGAPEAA
jgi:hypothetical protein